VGRDGRHRFSKPVTAGIRLIEGFGVEGDAHAGATVQHRYLVVKDPTAANLTQVQITGHQEGLMRRLIGTDAAGQVVRKAGPMGIVVRGGTVTPGDAIRVELPAGEQLPLGVV